MTTATLEQKRTIAEAIEERRRRIRDNGIKYFVPQPQQLPFHKSPSRIRCAFGANRELSISTEVRMADGSKKPIGKLNIGDMILAWDGKNAIPSKVIDIPYDGNSETWKMTTKGGLSVESSIDHCFPSLSYVRRGVQKHTLQEIKDSNHKLKRMVRPEQFEYIKTEVPFSGLLLGLYLGDGSYGNSPSSESPRPNFTNVEENIRDLFCVGIKEAYSTLKCKPYPSDLTRLYVRGECKGKNYFINDLRILGLDNKKSHNKFIPDVFKYGSIAVRRGVIEGLILTDGGTDRYKVTIWSNSLRMLEDVSEIVLSLGGRSKIYKRGRSANKNQKQSYKLQFSVGYIKKMGIVGLGRKTPKVELKTNTREDDFIVDTISYVGVKRCRCITVEHHNHYFVLANGIVTSNSGKSVSGVCEGVWYSTGTHPYKDIPVPNYGRVVCTDFTNGIEKVIIPEYKKWMPKHMLKGESWEKAFHSASRTLSLVNGSTIEFMSNDQDVEKFAGASRHWTHFDEEPRSAIFKECRMRLIDAKGDLWITMTPDKGMSWVYSELYERAGEDPDIEVFTYGIYDNPYIDNDEIDMIKRGLSEGQIDAKIYGKFVQLSGLIYREYNPDVHNLRRFTIPSNWPKVCSIDPHPRNPTAVLYMAVAPWHLFKAECISQNIPTGPTPEGANTTMYIVYDEIYPGEPRLISEVAELMKAKEGRDYVSYRLIDNSANTPDPIVGTTIRQEFAKHGIRTILADKNVANRIFQVRAKLNTNTLRIMEDLPETIWEMRHYAWDDFKLAKDYNDPKEQPRKKRDHMMDNLGYMALSCPKFEPTKVFRPQRSTVDSATGY